MAVPGRSRAGSSTFGDHLHSLTHPPPEEKPVLILYIYQVPGKRGVWLCCNVMVIRLSHYS